MTRYSIKYTRIPTAYHDSAVAVVEAENPQNALELLRHKLGDHSGVRNYVFGEVAEYIPPVSEGKIVSLGGE
jgi:hypothetical protein